MAKGIPIDGEKFSALVNSTLLSHETFAAKIGMKRTSIHRFTRRGIHGMRGENFLAVADFAGLTKGELAKKVGGPGAVELVNQLDNLEQAEGQKLPDLKTLRDAALEFDTDVQIVLNQAIQLWQAKRSRTAAKKRSRSHQ